MNIQDILSGANQSTTYDHLIIDGPGLVHPSYQVHAGTSSDAAADGCATFWQQVDDLTEQYPDANILIVWDPRDNSRYRRGISPCYKFGRKPKDPELCACMVAVYREAERRFVSQITVPGYEADDEIASLARGGDQLPGRLLIVSNDHDLHQLVTDQVHQYHSRDGITMDPSTLTSLAKKQSTRHTHTKAIVGDTGDNVRGLPGVGPKVGDAILDAYPDFVDHCSKGRVAWDHIDTKSLRKLDQSGALLVHPVRIPGKRGDSLQCSAALAREAVRSTVVETLRLVSLEENITFEEEAATE